MNKISKITVNHLYNEISNAAQTAAPLFNLYGWTYGDKQVPTKDELVACITRLTESALEYFYKSEEEYREAEVGSGRFAVRVKEYEDAVQVKIVLEIGDKSWYKA